MAANALLGFAAVISSQPRHAGDQIEGESEEAAGDAWVGLEVGWWGVNTGVQSGAVGSRSWFCFPATLAQGVLPIF